MYNQAEYIGAYSEIQKNYAYYLQVVKNGIEL